MMAITFRVCAACVSDFGFSPSSLNATEGEVHMFQVKFFSGGIIGNDGFFFNLTLEHGTTSKYDNILSVHLQ